MKRASVLTKSLIFVNFFALSFFERCDELIAKELFFRETWSRLDLFPLIGEGVIMKKLDVFLFALALSACSVWATDGKKEKTISNGSDFELTIPASGDLGSVKIGPQAGSFSSINLETGKCLIKVTDGVYEGVALVGRKDPLGEKPKHFVKFTFRLDDKSGKIEGLTVKDE